MTTPDINNSIVHHLWITAFFLLCIVVSAGILIHEQAAHPVDIAVEASSMDANQSTEDHHDEEEKKDHILFNEIILLTTHSIKVSHEALIEVPIGYFRATTPPPPDLV